MNEISLILPNFPHAKQEKRSIIASLVSGFIGLAYEDISSFLHNRRHKALHTAVKAMENKVNLQHNKPMHIEDTMVMYGIYSAEMLEKLITAVHKMYNITTSNETLFTCKLTSSFPWYLTKEGVNHYAVNFLLYLIIVREKYTKNVCRIYFADMHVCKNYKNTI